MSKAKRSFHRLNMIGKRFGRLVVKADAASRREPNGAIPSADVILLPATAVPKKLFWDPL